MARRRAPSCTIATPAFRHGDSVVAAASLPRNSKGIACHPRTELQKLIGLQLCYGPVPKEQGECPPPLPSRLQLANCYYKLHVKYLASFSCHRNNRQYLLHHQSKFDQLKSEVARNLGCALNALLRRVSEPTLRFVYNLGKVNTRLE